jgi:hypothetical protein
VWTRQRRDGFQSLRKADRQPSYGALKPLLEDHAEQLAEAIDHRRSREAAPDLAGWQTLRRMRTAAVPESDEYPGGPCV